MVVVQWVAALAVWAVLLIDSKIKTNPIKKEHSEFEMLFFYCYKKPLQVMLSL